jgi:hypothetical protein
VGAEEDLVAGALVVVGEPATAVAHRHDAAGPIDPTERAGVGRTGRRAGEVGRAQRVAREDVLDVHEEQLLVLLLVVEAEGHELVDRLADVGREDGAHRTVDGLPVGPDLGGGRPGDLAALGPGVPGADGLVVRVEQVAEGLVERLVAGVVGLEDERLEEPGGVGPVPLRGADVGHRLDGLVLGTERRGQRLGEVAHGVVPGGEGVTRRRRLGGDGVGGGRWRHGASSGAGDPDGGTAGQRPPRYPGPAPQPDAPTGAPPLRLAAPPG